MLASSAPESYNIEIILILAVGFAFASVLGYMMQKTKLSPIIGYLTAGYLIGPYSPGFVADLAISEQLAEIGVVLMMFGVGLHFQWQELLNVKKIALPGALVQTTIAVVSGMLVCRALGWSYQAGLVIGLSIGVASTVVLVRVLEENHYLKSPSGHIAVGWTIVEDLITVIALLLLPVIALSTSTAAVPLQEMSFSILTAILKCAVLLIIMFAVGFRVVEYILYKVAQTRSQELFTLTLLALIFVIAVGSSYLFGTSIALGAFIAGMVIGKTDVKHQAYANALPLKDAFAVIFFLSIGMLFNPSAIAENALLFFAVLGIILIIKPLSAFLIILLLKKPMTLALTVAALLAQIGEFSFILSEQAMNLHIIPESGFDILVACALASIALNPVLFKLSLMLRSKMISHIEVSKSSDVAIHTSKRAIIVGYGPIGHAVYHTLEELGYLPVVIDTNLEMVTKLTNQKKTALYGDASQQQILEAAQIADTEFLVITSPDISSTVNIVKTAMQLNPKMEILVRANYTSDQKELNIPGIRVICNEEEAKAAFVHEIRKSKRIIS
jgi:monovalent cation:H+ antiporter-2, CPA2 family